MKKYIFILAIFISQNVRSQAYRPFDTTTVWNTLRKGVGTSCYPDSLYSYFVKGYIVNNGYTWYKVYANCSLYKPAYAPFHSSTCMPLSSAVTPFFMGMFNNDSTNKKVYFVPSATLSPNFVPNNNVLEFDFNKSTGDTITCNNSGSSTNLRYSITSIDSIMFDGKYHKHFICTPLTFIQYAPYAYFIEGIGATCGVFYSDLDALKAHCTPLICFSGVSSSKAVIGNECPFCSPSGIRDTISCNYVFTTSFRSLSFQNPEITLYPNPNNGQFNISIDNPGEETLEVSISDVSSRTLRVFKIDAWVKNEGINLEDLSCGVYILNISRNKQTVYTTKLIKQGLY